MDPISLTASIIAVLQLCAATGKVFISLREICKSLPGRLHALSEEVEDFRAVLRELSTLLEERSRLRISPNERDRLPLLLERATSKLIELRGVLEELVVVCRSSRVALIQANSWRKVQERLKRLQDDIHNVKTSLNILLGASNS